MTSVLEFAEAKRDGRKIAMVTAYDSWTARALSGRVDCVLVGDSVMMVIHGEEDTLGATPELMALHTRAVAKGKPGALIVADMPFLAARRGRKYALDCAAELLRAGAGAVKIEGARGNLDVIRHLVESGIPVMGHLGLTPQSSHTLGGFKVQGREPASAGRILNDASDLEAAGVFALVLECVPASLARQVSHERAVPIIGIGAGPDCDGQVLVLHDLLGFLPHFQPRFARRFVEGAAVVTSGVESYCQSVRDGTFPTPAESFG